MPTRLVALSMSGLANDQSICSRGRIFFLLFNEEKTTSRAKYLWTRGVVRVKQRGAFLRRLLNCSAHQQSHLAYLCRDTTTAICTTSQQVRELFGGGVEIIDSLFFFAGSRKGCPAAPRRNQPRSWMPTGGQRALSCTPTPASFTLVTYLGRYPRYFILLCFSGLECMLVRNMPLPNIVVAPALFTGHT